MREPSNRFHQLFVFRRRLFVCLCKTNAFGSSRNLDVLMMHSQDWQKELG